MDHDALHVAYDTTPLSYGRLQFKMSWNLTQT